MPDYQFSVGDHVRITSSALTSAPAGPYEIVARMPRERAEIVSYRLRSTADNHQRVAGEHSLTRA